MVGVRPSVFHYEVHSLPFQSLVQVAFFCMSSVGGDGSGRFSESVINFTSLYFCPPSTVFLVSTYAKVCVVSPSPWPTLLCNRCLCLCPCLFSHLLSALFFSLFPFTSHSSAFVPLSLRLATSPHPRQFSRSLSLCGLFVSHSFPPFVLASPPLTG